MSMKYYINIDTVAAESLFLTLTHPVHCKKRLWEEFLCLAPGVSPGKEEKFLKFENQSRITPKIAYIFYFFCCQKLHVKPVSGFCCDPRPILVSVRNIFFWKFIIFGLVWKFQEIF